MKWPPALVVVFDVLNWLTLPGMLSVFDFKLECLTGSDLIWKLLRDVLAPLTVFGNFLLLAGLNSLCRLVGLLSEPMKLDFVINIIGLWFTKLFITITGMTLEVFFVDVMPSGVQMVKAYPELEFMSDQGVSSMYFPNSGSLRFLVDSNVMFCKTDVKSM